MPSGAGWKRNENYHHFRCQVWNGNWSVVFFTLTRRRSWDTRRSTSSWYVSSPGLHARTAIKKTTQASYPIILLMLSARGRAFSLFDYLRYHCYEICSQFMKVRWDCSMAAFASYDCPKNFTVFRNKRAHPQTRNIVSLKKKKRRTCHSKVFTLTIQRCNHHQKKMHWPDINTLKES